MQKATNYIRGSVRLEAVGPLSGAVFQYLRRPGHPVLEGGAGG